MRDDRQRLEDIIETCSNLEGHITDREGLASNPLVQAAAQRWLEVIGEAAARLSPSIRERYRDVAPTGDKFGDKRRVNLRMST